MTETLEWALRYRDHKMSVIPVGKDKRPKIDWKKYQTEIASKEQVEEWFKGETPPGIGIVTGKISGITVVDVEKGGKWKDLPPTMTAETGGGGVHLYYKYAEGVGNSVRIRELTDIRGDGGYVVAPPSGHHSGGVYKWTKKEKPQPFPYEVFGEKPTVKTDWGDLLKGLDQGERNNSAAKVVGKLLKSFPPEEWNTNVWELVVMWNQKNTPPLEERELRATFNSICGRELRKPQEDRAYKAPEGVIEEEKVDVRLISDIAKDITDDMSISYPTGYKVYDEAFMGGFKDGDLVVLSGFTGHGKTHFAQSITHNMVNAGQPCLWFSYEVGMGELWRKFKAMGVEDSFLAYSPERVINQKVDFVAQKIIEARDAFKTKIVFIDHLGFLATDPANYDQNLSSNYATQLTTICRKLKSIAVAEGVVIVLLAHLKKPAKNTDEPSYHDLKDSSGVAQEADSVVLIHRQKLDSGSKYTNDSSDGEIYSNESKVKIEKNRRTGATKIFKVEMWNGVLLDEDTIMEKAI